VILLAEHDEPPLTAKKKRRLGASSRPTSTPKNRVWGFESIPSGRPGADLDLSWEIATVSVQYTYQNASGRAGWLSRDPLKHAEMSQGPNLYEYVKNDPMIKTDPLGQKIIITEREGDVEALPCPYTEPSFTDFLLAPIFGAPAAPLPDGIVIKTGRCPSRVELEDTSTGNITRLGPNTIWNHCGDDGIDLQAGTILFQHGSNPPYKTAAVGTGVVG
jgi:hypothetical protein